MFPVTDLYLPGLAPIQSLPPIASWAFARGTNIDTSTNTPIIRNMLWDSHWARPPAPGSNLGPCYRQTAHAARGFHGLILTGPVSGNAGLLKASVNEAMRGRPYRSAF